jgi:hypothetical protein
MWIKLMMTIYVILEKMQFFFPGNNRADPAFIPAAGQGGRSIRRQPASR